MVTAKSVLKTTSSLRDQLGDIIQDVSFSECKDINISAPPFFHIFRMIFQLLESYISISLRPSPNIIECDQLSTHNESECSICFEAHTGTGDSQNFLRLPCNHVFHRKCIDKWFIQLYDQEKTCPLCRQSIV